MNNTQSKDRLNYECLKQTSIANNRLRGYGYALAPYEKLGADRLEFRWRLHSQSLTSFVFGFQGVGHHYRFEAAPSRSLLTLFWIRDGMAVYLQHASVALAKGMEIQVSWATYGLAVAINNVCLINVITEDLDEGKWGFASTSSSVEIPTVSLVRRPATGYQWVIIGDGYSNNRWKNRHFFSWPELAFGNRGHYLNACVAAGNTRRVLQITERISAAFENSDVLIAAGADDFIENESTAGFLVRIRSIVEKARESGAIAVHLCSIPPRGNRDDEVIRRNEALAELARTLKASFIDFHSLLSPVKNAVLINGDYPGAEAQRILAQAVLDHLDVPGDLAPLSESKQDPAFRGLQGRLAACAVNWLERGLSRIPTPGV